MKLKNYLLMLLLAELFLKGSEKPLAPIMLYEEHIVHLDLPMECPALYRDIEDEMRYFELLVASRIKNNQSLDTPIEGRQFTHTETALYLACRSDRANDLVKKMLAHGADPNFLCSVGYASKETSLYIAVKCNATENVKALLQAGANTELYEESWEKETPLLKACWGGERIPIEKQYAIIEALLAAGANPNARKRDNFTSLFGLVRGDEKCKYPIKLLLEHGAYTHLKNDKGETVFTFARERLHTLDARMLADYIEQERKPIHLCRLLWGKRAKEAIFNQLPKDVVMMIVRFVSNSPSRRKIAKSFIQKSK